MASADDTASELNAPAAPDFKGDAAAHAAAIEKAGSCSHAQIRYNLRSNNDSNVIDAPGPHGSTPLVAACSLGDAGLVAKLLSLGADPTVVGKEGQGGETIHFQIDTCGKARWGDDDDDDDEDDADPDPTFALPTLPLLAAARYNHPDIVRLLIRQLSKETVNNVNKFTGETAMNCACLNGHVGVVEALLEHPGIDTDVVGIGDDTANMVERDTFHWRGGTMPALLAVCTMESTENSRRIFRTLLKHGGIDVNVILNRRDGPDPNHTHFKPLLEDIISSPLGALCGKVVAHDTTILRGAGESSPIVDMIKLLLQHSKIEVDYGADFMNSPLNIVCRLCSWPQRIPSKEAGARALHAQNQSDQLEVAALLLDRGASLSQASGFHSYGRLSSIGCGGVWPLLHLVCITGNERVVKLLLDEGAEVNGVTAQDVDDETETEENVGGVTPLLAMLSDPDHNPTNQIPILKLLLESGADINLPATSCIDNRVKTPFQAAVQYIFMNGEAAMFFLTYSKAANKLLDVNKRNDGICHPFRYGPRALVQDVYAQISPIHAFMIHSYEYQLRETELMVAFLNYVGSSGTVDVNRQTSYKSQTALHIACSNLFSAPDGNTDPYLSILLSSFEELNVDAVDEDGCTALHRACMQTEWRCHGSGVGGKPKPPFEALGRLNEIASVLPTVQLLITFGASLTLPATSSGLTAVDIAADLASEPLPMNDEHPYWINGGPSGDPDKQADLYHTTSVNLGKWFVATDGWSSIEVGAGCRFYKEILSAVQQGVIDLDDCELPQLKRALAIAQTAPEDLAGWERGQAVCNRTVRLMQTAVHSWHKGWVPVGHWLYHTTVREAVHTVMLVAERLDGVALQWGGGGSVAELDRGRLERGVGDSARGPSPRPLLPVLPSEIWCFIMKFLKRDDWIIAVRGGEWI